MVAETERDAYAKSGSEKEQQGLSEVAETARGKAASGAERVFAWLSPGSLTARIVLINVIGLIILASGILYLNQFRQGLIDARVQAMSTQGQIIAAAIAASATVNTDSVVIDTERLLAATERKSVNPEDEYLRNLLISRRGAINSQLRVDRDIATAIREILQLIEASKAN